MDIEWLPEVVQYVEFFDRDKPCQSTLPENCPDFAFSMVATLFYGTYQPVVEIPPYERRPPEKWAVARKHSDIHNMAIWALEILRTNDIDRFWSCSEEHERPSFLVRSNIQEWTFDSYHAAYYALDDLFASVSGELKHVEFPGCPDQALSAFPENLVAAIGFLAFNQMLVAWKNGDHVCGMSLVAAGYLAVRHALEKQGKRVGHETARLFSNREMRNRGRVGGVVANAHANKLKAWAALQPNPTNRTDKPFARALAKAAPAELKSELADPERVIYDYLRMPTKDTAA